MYFFLTFLPGQAGLILKEHNANACTDVTGFGLIGHLSEMLRGCELAAELWLEQIPVLPGVHECIAKGIFSSLYPENARLRHAVASVADAQHHPSFPLLFDPQTAGGLLASMPANSSASCVAALLSAGYRVATIGRVVAQEDSGILVNVLSEKEVS